MTDKLTTRQQIAYNTIIEFVREQGFSPTVRDLGAMLGRSTSTVHKLLCQLENKGYISRREGISRGIFINDAQKTTNLVPILGTIAAGEPIFAEGHYEGAIEVDSSILGRGEHFALKVRGDSMIDANILDGDTAIIKSADDADSGEIVAVIIDGEATLKRLNRKRGKTLLLPENKAYEPIELDESKGHAQILGKLKAVIRKY